jgi:DNA-binding LacI/PurR family transcriptional regulator
MDVTRHIRVDRNSPLPLETQIAHQIAQLIAANALPPGTRLPTLRQLSAVVGVNIHTVRAAYLTLERQGLVDVTQGRGTTVASQSLGGFAVGDNRRSFTIGVLMPALVSFYSPVAAGLTAAADADPSGLMYAFANERLDSAIVSLRRFLTSGVDGVIVVSQAFDQPIDFRSDSMPPFVFCDWPGSPEPAVVFDPAPLGELILHLVDHGHRDIALVSPPRRFANVRPLVDVYSDTCRRLGLEKAASNIHEVPGWTMDHGETMAEGLLVGPDRPTAVVAATDDLAIGVMRAARRLRLRPGQDIAVTGYGGTEVSALVDPGLTTVILPAWDLGYQAMTLLLAMIDGAPVPRLVKLAGRTVIRASCGCPSSADT